MQIEILTSLCVLYRSARSQVVTCKTLCNRYINATGTRAACWGRSLATSRHTIIMPHLEGALKIFDPEMGLKKSFCHNPG